MHYSRMLTTRRLTVLEGVHTLGRNPPSGRHSSRQTPPWTDWQTRGGNITLPHTLYAGGNEVRDDAKYNFMWDEI